MVRLGSLNFLFFQLLSQATHNIFSKSSQKVNDIENFLSRCYQSEETNINYDAKNSKHSRESSRILVLSFASVDDFVFHNTLFSARNQRRWPKDNELLCAWKCSETLEKLCKHDEDRTKLGERKRLHHLFTHFQVKILSSFHVKATTTKQHRQDRVSTLNMKM